MAKKPKKPKKPKKRKPGGRKLGVGEVVPGVLVRGSDGSLYLISENDMGPFKLTKQQANELRSILRDVSLVVPKLPPDVVSEIQDFFDCVQNTHPEIEL
jgi:hypothetical protein